MTDFCEIPNHSCDHGSYYDYTVEYYGACEELCNEAERCVAFISESGSIPGCYLKESCSVLEYVSNAHIHIKREGTATQDNLAKYNNVLRNFPLHTCIYYLNMSTDYALWLTSRKRIRCVHAKQNAWIMLWNARFIHGQKGWIALLFKKCGFLTFDFRANIYAHF